MPPLTLLHILLTTLIITIGITLVIFRQTTPVGQLQKLRNRFTTHVQPVGAFLMEVVMVYGQRQDLMILHTIVQTRECLSVYHPLPQHGIRLRVIWASSMAARAMSVTTANVGLPLLSATTRSACTSAAMAASIRRAATIARAVTQSVVSNNQNES